MNSSVH